MLDDWKMSYRLVPLAGCWKTEIVQGGVTGLVFGRGDAWNVDQRQPHVVDKLRKG